jgi:peptidoglycan/xylan/chitin deacetylase (PgdA/CDA1 family)
MLLSAPGTLRQEIPILVYHRFDTTQAGPTTIRTRTFEGQLRWLTEHHYHVVPLRSAIEALRGSSSTDQPAIVITADDGHRSIYTEMFPMIQRYRLPVTLFIYPSTISNSSYSLTWEQLLTMKGSGLVDVQSHTYWHPNFKRERSRLAPAEYRAFVAFQLAHSKDILEKKLGGKNDMLAWPFGIYDAELEEAALRAGYSAAFAFSGGSASPGCNLLAIPRIPVSDEDRGARFGALLSRIGRTN